MKQNLFKLFSIFIFFLIIAACGSKTETSAAKNSTLKENSEIKITEDYYFKYSFNQKPSMGTIILKVQVFDKNNKQVKSFTIFGEAGMPSMRGAHDSGLNEFMLNKKDDYLLPVNVVMPGDWEVQIIIKKDSRDVFKGTIEFNI
jgi:hypothetical protein